MAGGTGKIEFTGSSGADSSGTGIVASDRDETVGKINFARGALDGEISG